MHAKTTTLLVVGAGNRGTTYAQYAAQAAGGAKVVGVAEPLADQRERMVEQHVIPREHAFDDWRAAAERDQFADATIIATQDAMHTEPAVAFLERGYHVLLEKPMAPTESECRCIVAAARATERIFAVCHVLRYTPVSRKIKQLVDAGAIGDVVTIDRLEPVGYWHQAHSFVRGHWRNEGASSFMLLAKGCHDLDWIRFVMGVPCRSVHSFGSLMHFQRDGKPSEAGDALRCLDCAYEPKCPYSAKKIYLGRLHQGHTRWPVVTLTNDLTEAGLTRALREGPYGRCVYECDNDVVDHQVVNMQFEVYLAARGSPSILPAIYTCSTSVRLRLRLKPRALRRYNRLPRFGNPIGYGWQAVISRSLAVTSGDRPPAQQALCWQSICKRCYGSDCCVDARKVMNSC